MPSGPILGDPTPGARFYSFVRNFDPVSNRREISCEIRALSVEELAAALNSVLRSVAAHAGLAEAVLETRAIRLADPSVAPPALVDELACRLREADLPVSLGSSWTPAYGAHATVGIRGLEDAFEAFLQSFAYRIVTKPDINTAAARTVG